MGKASACQFEIVSTMKNGLMTKGRKPLLQDQVQGICENCQINKRMPAPRSKLGFKKYTPLCSSCTKKKYGLGKYHPSRKKKKPHCERCGFIGDACQLDIHHKDRNHKNNEESNLETLCANCHRLEHKEELKLWGAGRLG